MLQSLELVNGFIFGVGLGMTILSIGVIAILLVAAGVTVVVDMAGRRVYKKLCALHGVMKVRMALQNSKFIRWQWPDIDDLEDRK